MNVDSRNIENGYEIQGSRLGPYLRYYVPPDDREAHLDELIRTCERLGIRDVFLFSTQYLANAPFMAMGELERVCEHLALCARRLRAGGLGFHLNVMQTLGHIHVPQHEIEQHGFQRQLRADGKPGAHPVLDPACPQLQAYLQQAYRLYGQLQPGLLFVDDDFTVRFTQCFVPERVARFAVRFGCPDDPKVVASLLAEENERARRLMAELITDDLVSLATVMREAVHEVSPHTRLGLMHPDVDHQIAPVARALAGSHRPFVRPQIPLYRENASLPDYPGRFWKLDAWMASLPEDFEFFPECENYPYDPALKSPVAAYAHHAYILSVGEPKVALSLNGSPGGGKVPNSESRSLVDYFAARKGQLSAIGKLLQGGAAPLGAGVWVDHELQRLGCLHQPPLKPLQARGVPVRCVRRPEDAVIHWGDSLRHLDDDRLDAILQRGAFLDLQAAQALHDRGRLEETGLTLGERCRATDVMRLRYDRRDGDVELWPYFYFVGRLPGNKYLPFHVLANEGTVHASYLNEQGRVSVPHLLTWSSASGARFALLNASTDAATGESLLSLWSAPCMVHAIEWVQGAPLPARTISEGAFLLKALRLGSDDAMLLTLWNLSTAPAAAATLRLAPALAGWSWASIEADGDEHPLDVQAIDGASCIALQQPLPSLDCAFMVARRTWPTPFARPMHGSPSWG